MRRILNQGLDRGKWATRLLAVLGCVCGLVLVGSPSVEARQISRVHRANMGKIVWSSKRIQARRERPRTFRKSFRVGQPIFGRIYARQPLGRTATYLDKGGRCSGQQQYYGITVHINGKKYKKHRISRYFHWIGMHKSGVNVWHTWRIEPHAKPIDQNANHVLNVKFAALINTLPAGRHKITFGIYATDRGACHSRAKIAEGSFFLRKKKGARLRAKVKLPKDKFRGSGRGRIKRAVKKALLRRRIAKSSRAFLGVWTLSRNWTFGRFRYSRQRYRTIAATVLWRDTDGDGICSYTSYNFIQTKAGRGWNALKFRSFCLGCRRGRVSCP